MLVPHDGHVLRNARQWSWESGASTRRDALKVRGLSGISPSVHEEKNIGPRRQSFKAIECNGISIGSYRLLNYDMQYYITIYIYTYKVLAE